MWTLTVAPAPPSGPMRDERHAVALVALATATIPPSSPSDIVMAPGRAGALHGAGRQDDLSTLKIAVARVSRPALTAWLATAINRLLDGQPPAQPRPHGALFEHGVFEPAGVTVWARSWYGVGKRLAVATCADAQAARDLAAQLNTLLRDA